MTLSDLIRQALERRQSHLPSWTSEGNDSFRIFHGVSEGRPGLNIDRYGPLTLAQIASRLPLDEQERAQVLTAFSTEPLVLARREGSRLELEWESSPGLWNSRFWCRELGLEFALDLSIANRDPQLFLDFRAAKRALKQRLSDWTGPASIANLFAYTCSISCHAAQAGAQEVVSVDFSAGNLQWGRRNFRRNALPVDGEFWEMDCMAALWAWSGNQKALSRHKGRSSGPALTPRQFSVVIVDPPVFSKGKYATVDLIRDPETVFGPAWDIVEPGGLLVAANNSAKVVRDEFQARLLKMMEKRSGANSVDLEWIETDADFPSFDSEHPLKVAFCRKLS